MKRKKKVTSGTDVTFSIRTTDNSGMAYFESCGNGIFAWVIDGVQVARVTIPLSCECCGCKIIPTFGPYLDESDE